jgi:hypothetical protein
MLERPNKQGQGSKPPFSREIWTEPGLAGNSNINRHYGIGHDLLRFDGANEIPPSSSFSYKSWIASVVPGTLASQEDAPR